MDFEFLRDLETTVIPIFEINLVKLDYAQTRLDEIIQYEQKVIVQAEMNHLGSQAKMKAQK